MRLTRLAQTYGSTFDSYSSTVYDALGFDVPTIFADEQALEYFSELLELEDVCYLAEPLQITECINERLRV